MISIKIESLIHVEDDQSALYETPKYGRILLLRVFQMFRVPIYITSNKNLVYTEYWNRKLNLNCIPIDTAP